MKKLFQGNKLRNLGVICVLWALIITGLFGLRFYAVTQNQTGCWSVKTTIVSVDMGSSPTCYTRETPPGK